MTPLFEIDWKRQRIDVAVASFQLFSQASNAADSGHLILHDPDGDLALAKGDAISIRWGYPDDAALTRIFHGAVREIQASGLQTIVHLIDWQTILQARGRAITRTWEHSTPAEIAGDLIAGTGLTLAAQAPAITIDRFPIHGLTPKEALLQLVQWVKRETGDELRFHVRDGALVLAKADHGQAAVHAIETGVNLIDRRPGKLGMSEVETLVAPVLHSQVVTLDGARCFVEEAEYRWQSGGRLVLQVVPCAQS
ncbi:MAG: hypothetical protein Q8O14_14505 [bacterium]|nr:hypothetical protein [bacterium]